MHETTIAARQHGVTSIEQLRSVGLTRSAVSRRVQAGRLHRIHRGVYAVGHTALTHEARDLAAVLACGPGAALSHRSAAYRWALVQSTTRTEVTSPRHVRRVGITTYRSALAPEDRAARDGVPVTSPARTLVDLADVLSERRLAAAVHEAEVQRIFDGREVHAALERARGRRGVHRLRRVLAAYQPPAVTRNDAEKAFLRLCDDHAIPTPQSNVLVGPYEVDFLWAEQRLVVELDGRATHGTTRAFQEDRRRDRWMAVRGIQVLRVTWWDLAERPATVAGELRQVLLARC